MTFPSSSIWTQLHKNYRISEMQAVQNITQTFSFASYPKEEIEKLSRKWASELREGHGAKALSVNQLLSVFPLDQASGRGLMILAEALLRIPDKGVREALITEKLTEAKWYNSAKNSKQMLIKMIGVGLDLSRHVLSFGEGTVFEALSQFSKKLTTPLIRETILRTISHMGDLFVVGEDTASAINRADADTHNTYSFDMLGEAAICFEDSTRYFEEYLKTIHAVGKAGHSGVSVKLSALYPRYEPFKRIEAIKSLSEQLLELAKAAATYNLRLMVDAEESERLCLSIEIFERVFLDPALKDYNNFGMAIQAYQKRALAVIDFLEDLAKRAGKTLPVRLVKGAYWDREIKVTQEQGLIDFPVFTQKVHTDANYLACAQKLLDIDQITPQFASHNVHTLAAIIHMAGDRPFVLQRLQGMGEEVFSLIQRDFPKVSCEIYAPVGPHKDLLAYLVRRLLENGASSSFVHQLMDETTPLNTLIQDPFSKLEETGGEKHQKILLPKDMFEERENSNGEDFSDYSVIESYEKTLANPPPSASLDKAFDIEAAFAKAKRAQKEFEAMGVIKRANMLEKLADLLENDQKIIPLIVYEGRRTLVDAHSELREAVDFCRYYASQARKYMENPNPLPGPVGETNELSLHPRGVYVCISPWNFPLAIFLGQITAALAAGNAVIAKPASATMQIAHHTVQLAYQAGMPKDVLQLCLLPASDMDKVIAHPNVAGVALTGSTETAFAINQQLAVKKGPIVPLIAETGGLNAMVVDSSCLFEQVVQDVITSAFRSAGQRCSALRLLCIQEDIAQPLIDLLIHAMKTLKVGPSDDLTTDVAPVINSRAKEGILEQLKRLKKRAKLLHAHKDLGEDYVAPQLWQINSVTDVDEEIFGPVLQVVTYQEKDFEATLQQINDLGYGLTFGLHTRLESTIKRAQSIIKAGNIYVNRSMIGAVVGVQPFGGEGLSGTGFKAGGPHYLLRFMVERTLSYNTTAAGGNATLVMQVK